MNINKTNEIPVVIERFLRLKIPQGSSPNCPN